MRIAICDDDEKELSHLSELIAKYKIGRGIDIDCHRFHNGIDFLSTIKGGEYDLVLLDVLMPGISGMQIAQELRKLDENVKLIFVSASSEFAMESYSVGAYHYLLKPADANTLYSLLDKVENELSVQKEQKLILKTREGVAGVSFTSLEYVEVINKSISIHLADGTIRKITATLADFENMLLLRPEFLKTHRSYLVNLNYVQSVDINCVMTKNGHRIPVSRQRRNQVQETFIRFLHREEPTACTPNAQSFTNRQYSDGSWQILLIDDDAAERNFWADILRSHGCVVRMAENGRRALALAAGASYDCILLDVMIPGEDGFSICEELHKLTNTPIIFLSCLTESEKQLEGFAVGGIDYITKDTPPELFWAKVETRIKLASSDRTGFCYGPLLLDLAKRRVIIDGKELLLTPIEFDILWRLTERAEHIVTPEELFDMVWPGQPWDGGQTVQTHMSRLRRKLEKAWSKHHFIEIVWGQGYRFVPTNNGLSD